MDTIEDLFEIVQTLRSEKGCPWDRKQTPETIWKCLVEESYELEEALIKKDLPNVVEELGDVLFQLIFLIQIFQEDQSLKFSEVIRKIAQKMIRRHPHVYEHDTSLTEDELNQQWADIKADEKENDSNHTTSVLDRVPKGMPALMRALNVSKCAVKEGFDWDNIHGVLKTVRDELDEFEAAIKVGGFEEMNLEFGDILFSLVNVARFAKIYPEVALANSTEKFDRRFRIMEAELKLRKVRLKDLSREEIDAFWEEAKKKVSLQDQEA